MVLFKTCFLTDVHLVLNLKHCQCDMIWTDELLFAQMFNLMYYSICQLSVMTGRNRNNTALGSYKLSSIYAFNSLYNMYLCYLFVRTF